jgi:hypothetical protein
MWSPLSLRSRPQRHFGTVDLHNRGLRIIRGGAQHVQQESGGGVFLIGIQILSHRYEPNAVPFQVVNVVEAVDKRAPKPVQLPNQVVSSSAQQGLPNAY